MQKKTRFIALFLGLMMLMSLAACQKAPAQEPAQEETQVQEPVQEEPAQEESPAQEEEPVQEEEPAQDEDFGIFTEIAGENGTTYANLFDVILDESCDEIWLQKCEAIVGSDGAADAADMLKHYISRDIYGQDAVDAYTSPELVGFDCWYINGAQDFTFDGHDVTATLTDGTTQTHTYTYLGKYRVGEGETMIYGGQEIDPSFECDVYQSTDDAGEFTYFLLRDDTMAETYHIEFRYGSDLDQLLKYFTGPYAYWLSAGIDENADAQTIDNVIDLFVTENLSGE